MIVFRFALALSLASSSISSRAAALRFQEHDPAGVLRQGEAVFDAQIDPELEVLRARTGHLLVRPVINGIEAGWFIFDTGAGICVVSTPRAGDFELTEAGEVAANGMGGGTPAHALRAAELVLGPATLHDIPLMKTDLSFLREHLGVDVDGVIGYGVLAKCIVELDLAKPRIALHEPAKYTLASGAWLPLELDDLIPAISARFEGKDGRFHLDIGSNTGLTFQEPAVRRHALLEGREVIDAKLGGVGGFIAAKQGRIAWLELAGVRLENLEATFAIEARGLAAQEGRDGSIGTRVLDAFHLTLDYSGKRICFVKREEGAK